MGLDNPTIVAVAALLSATAALGAFVNGFITRQKVQELHVIVNSRLEELVKSSSALARSEGLSEGHAAGLAEGLDLSRVPVVSPPVIVVVPNPAEKKGES